MHALYAHSTWAGLHRGDCVLVIVVLGWKPLEDVRKSRLRSVTKHHCCSANGFSWGKNPATKKKKIPSLHCTATSTPPPQPHTVTHTSHTNTVPTYPVTVHPKEMSLSPEDLANQPFLLNWGGMKAVSCSSQLTADILWKWPCFFPPPFDSVYRIVDVWTTSAS